MSFCAGDTETVAELSIEQITNKQYKYVLETLLPSFFFLRFAILLLLFSPNWLQLPMTRGKKKSAVVCSREKSLLCDVNNLCRKVSKIL